MKRRNFIKNTGLSIAGLALSNSLYSKNVVESKNLNIIILMSGGVRYNDIIDIKSNNISAFLPQNLNIEVNTKTNVKYTGDKMEHEHAFLSVLDGLNSIAGKKILISNINSGTTKSVVEAEFPFKLITTLAVDTEQPFRNDAAVFEMAMQNLNHNENATIILNLEDTDVAHYSPEDYTKVLSYYKLQLDTICQKIYADEFRKNTKANLYLASVLGRNNYNNELSFSSGASDHYDESARSLFCFQINYANQYQHKIDTAYYDSKEVLLPAHKMSI